MGKQLIKNKEKYTVNTIERQYKPQVQTNDTGNGGQDWKKPEGKMLVVYILAGLIIICLIVMLLSNANKPKTTVPTTVQVIHHTEQVTNTGPTSTESALDLSN